MAGQVLVCGPGPGGELTRDSVPLAPLKLRLRWMQSLVELRTSLSLSSQVRFSSFSKWQTAGETELNSLSGETLLINPNAQSNSDLRYMYDYDGNGVLDQNDFECLAVRNTILEVMFERIKLKIQRYYGKFTKN